MPAYWEQPFDPQWWDANMGSMSTRDPWYMYSTDQIQWMIDEAKKNGTPIPSDYENFDPAKHKAFRDAGYNYQKSQETPLNYDVRQGAADYYTKYGLPVPQYIKDLQAGPALAPGMLIRPELPAQYSAQEWEAHKRMRDDLYRGQQGMPDVQRQNQVMGNPGPWYDWARAPEGVERPAAYQGVAAAAQPGGPFGLVPSVSQGQNGQAVATRTDPWNGGTTTGPYYTGAGTQAPAAAAGGTPAFTPTPVNLTPEEQNTRFGIYGSADMGGAGNPRDAIQPPVNPRDVAIQPTVSPRDASQPTIVGAEPANQEATPLRDADRFSTLGKSVFSGNQGTAPAVNDQLADLARLIARQPDSSAQGGYSLGSNVRDFSSSGQMKPAVGFQANAAPRASVPKATPPIIPFASLNQAPKVTPATPNPQTAIPRIGSPPNPRNRFSWPFGMKAAAGR